MSARGTAAGGVIESMLLDFPDIAGHEKETLFIIGNGFDVAHGLRTRYADFHDWLMKDHQDFVEQIEAIFYDRDQSRFTDDEVRPSLLWTDFEAALGRIDANSALRYLEENFGEVDTDKAALGRAVEQMRSMVAQVNTLMLEWAQSISVASAHCLYNMTNESKYLSFNYTLTLEELYHVEDVKHIHGCVRDDSVIVGCGRDDQRLPDSNQDRRRYTREINNELNHFNKPIDDIIENREDSYFQSLASITRVVVIGHSLSEIDLPYFQEVKDHVSKEAHWHFSAFSGNDHQNIVEFINNSMDGLETLRSKKCYIFNVGLKEDEPSKPNVREPQSPPIPSKRSDLVKRRRNQRL